MAWALKKAAAMSLTVSVPAEADLFAARSVHRLPIERMSIEIQSASVEGLALPLVPGLRDVAMDVIVKGMPREEARRR